MSFRLLSETYQRKNRYIKIKIYIVLRFKLTLIVIRIYIILRLMFHVFIVFTFQNCVIRFSLYQLAFLFYLFIYKATIFNLASN